MLNKTQKASDEKTKSAPNKTVVGLLVAAALLVFAASVVGLAIARSKEPTAKVNGSVIRLEIADTPDAQAKGLSGRSGLDKHQGMLFVFQDNAAHCFWMKDMQFNIDIVWLDGDQRVVHVEKDVSPATYPNSFCPKEDNRYALEVAAGKAQDMGVSVGQKVDLKL
jgi:uncharacterized membrane protein (UPF0127 family)